MNLYSDEDFIHPIGADADWQESVVLIFSDEASGLAGFFRIGSEPNLGLSQVYFNLVSRDGLRFRHNPFDLAMQPGDRTADGFAAESLHWRIPKREFVHLTGTHGEVSVDLRLHDFYPSTPWQMLGTGGLEKLAPGHVESSGRVEGRVVVGDRVFTIDNALGHRDHSWGRRDVRVMRSFRWVAGTCGPQLSFSGLVLHMADGHFMRAGFIRRNDVLCPLRDFDVLAQVNPDGLTVRGGTAEWTLADGARVVLEASVIDGVITSYRSDHGGRGSHIGVEGLSVARCGALNGFCDFNVSNNLAGGEQPAPSVCEEYATLKSGLSTRPQRNF
ncbi:MAG: DUF7064 domain-containing protein [Nevskiales bacterium]